MPHDHHHHDDPFHHEGMSPSGHPYRPDNDQPLTYWQRMEIAVRKLLVEIGDHHRGRGQRADRQNGRPHPGARRPRGDPGLNRSRVQAAPASRRLGGDGGDGHRPRRAEAGGGREHRQGAQRHRLHPVLLLPAQPPRPAARLVQDPRLPLAHRQGAARGAARVRPRPAGGRAHPGPRFDRRHALHGAVAPARGHRGLEPRAARGDRQPRLHDRGRCSPRCCAASAPPSPPGLGASWRSSSPS